MATTPRAAHTHEACSSTTTTQSRFKRALLHVAGLGLGGLFALSSLAAPSGNVTDSMDCPSKTRDRLAAVIGEPMTVRHQYSRGLVFFQEVDVHELRAGGDVFGTYNETAWRRNSNRELVVFLQLMQIACGVGVMWPAIKSLRAKPHAARRSNSAQLRIAAVTGRCCGYLHG